MMTDISVYSGAVVSTGASELEGSELEPASQQRPFCVEFAKGLLDSSSRLIWWFQKKIINLSMYSFFCLPEITSIGDCFKSNPFLYE